MDAGIVRKLTDDFVELAVGADGLRVYVGGTRQGVEALWSVDAGR